jgi:hypothetical protein
MGQWPDFLGRRKTVVGEISKADFATRKTADNTELKRR